MHHISADGPFTLSRAFHDKAERADALSYRKVDMTILHHVPGHPHVLQESDIRLYDRLETGLYDLMIVRAVLENPFMGRHLLPYLAPGRPAEPAGELASLRDRVRLHFNRGTLAAPSCAAEIDGLLARTEDEMEIRLDFLTRFPNRVELNFAGRGDADNVGYLETGRYSRYMQRARKTLTGWLTRSGDDAAPLNAVTLCLRAIDDMAELGRARRKVHDDLHPGQRIVTASDSWGRLALC